MKPELTPYELRIVKMIAEGMTAREIAAEMDKSPRTIESQKDDIMKKMEAGNAAALVAQCMRAGLIP